ncbi:MAG: hypothetical protein IJ055_04210 [Oscillospiraceae bacterium]|nr:hypothetical protein [Oscillospiraceae bacterium]
MKRTKKAVHVLLHVLLCLSTLVWPVLIDQLCAAGWRYNVREGNYPGVFSAYALWMTVGGVLMTAGWVLCLVGTAPKRSWWDLPAAGGTAIGFVCCMGVLSRFTAYADQNFSGIGESMEPVSTLYRDRLLPNLLPCVLCLVLAGWQFFSEASREARRDARRRREERLNAKAPKILD